MRNTPPVLLSLALACLLALPVSTQAAGEDIPLELPGSYRLALPSPDGSRLAILAGSGEAGKPHTLVVVDRACDAEAARHIVLTEKAVFPKQPEKVPAEFLRLAWSGDGGNLFAAGVIYAMGERNGEFKFAEVYTLERPVFDFRFGLKGYSIGVEFVSAGVRETSTGDKFIIELDYMRYRPSKKLAQPMDPREAASHLWVPKDWPDYPVVEWDEEGAMVFFYPYQQLTERMIPGKVRDEIKDYIPDGPPEAGEGPFSVDGTCRVRWRLNDLGARYETR